MRGKKRDVNFTVETLLKMLRDRGECIMENELAECLHWLVGERKFTDALKTEQVTADQFAEEILAFEEVEELEEEGG